MRGVHFGVHFQIDKTKKYHTLRDMIAIVNYPQLRLIAWTRQDDDLVDDQEALALYEANWRFIEPEKMAESERTLLERLVQQFGNGVLNV